MRLTHFRIRTLMLAVAILGTLLGASDLWSRGVELGAAREAAWDALATYYAGALKPNAYDSASARLFKAECRSSVSPSARKAAFNRHLARMRWIERYEEIKRARAAHPYDSPPGCGGMVRP